MRHAAPIEIIEHEGAAETKVMGFDHNPYSANFTGVPDAVALAARTGFGVCIPEVDVRQMEWDRV